MAHIKAKSKICLGRLLALKIIKDSATFHVSFAGFLIQGFTGLGKVFNWSIPTPAGSFHGKGVLKRMDK